MKKSISLLLILALTSVVFAACGGGGGSSPVADSPVADSPSTEIKTDEIVSEEPAAPTREGDLNNDDLMGPELGFDYGIGPAGYDLEKLVERMGSDVVRNLKIGISVDSQASAWLIKYANEFKNLSNKYGFEVVILSAESDPIKQTADLRSLQSQQVDGIIVYPAGGGAISSTVNEIYASGIPIVSQLPIAADTVISTTVKGSPFDRGALMADNVAKEANGADLYVMSVGVTADIPSLNNRNVGFKERAAELYPNIHIVAEPKADTIEKFLDVIKESLLTNDEVNLIFSTFDAPIIAGYQAAEQLGRPDIKHYGVDATETLLEMVLDGKVQGIQAQWADWSAAHCLFQLLRAIDGNKLPEFIPPPSDIYNYAYVDIKNAADYMRWFYGK